MLAGSSLWVSSLCCPLLCRGRHTCVDLSAGITIPSRKQRLPCPLMLALRLLEWWRQWPQASKASSPAMQPVIDPASISCTLGVCLKTGPDAFDVGLPLPFHVGSLAGLLWPTLQSTPRSRCVSRWLQTLTTILVAQTCSALRVSSVCCKGSWHECNHQVQSNTWMTDKRCVRCRPAGGRPSGLHVLWLFLRLPAHFHQTGHASARCGS